MLYLAPLQQRGWRLLTGRKSYEDLCDKQWTLCPGEQCNSPSAIYLEGELAKVTAVQEETTYADEVRRVEGGITQHAATVAYQLNNVQIHKGYVYKQAMKVPLTIAKENFFRSSEITTMSEAALACTFSGNRYFGHWMTDDLTLTLAARQLATPVTTLQNKTSHQVEYSSFLEIDSTPVSTAICKELILIQDFGQNRSKAERYNHIRSKFKTLSPLRSGHGVMLLRGNSGVQRPLLNENKVADFLSSQGFIIIDPQTTSAREIAHQTLEAKIAVGVEGSQLTHGLFALQAGGTILALQPPYRFNNVYKDYTDCIGLRYSFAVGKAIENGFEIEIETLARTLDKIDAQVN